MVVATAGSMWGPTGWDRLFLRSFGGQVSWLIPGALVGLVAALWMTRRAPRTDRTRAAFLLFGGWLLLTGLILSYAQGIIHPYYTVVLAPAVGALVGMGGTYLWHHRVAWFPRIALCLAIGATAAWAFVLLGWSPQWYPALRWAILAAGVLAIIGIAVTPRARGVLAAGIAGLGIAAVIAGPAAYAVDTASTPHSGSIPSAGPTIQGGGFGPGRRIRTGRRIRRPCGGFGAVSPGASPAAESAHLVGSPAAARRLPGSPADCPPASAPVPASVAGPSPSPAVRPGPSAGRGAAGPAACSTPRPRASSSSRLLESDASRYTWIAATTGANSAAGYQLATDDPVMAIGGFNGTDPSPTLAQFQAYVAEGKIHYYISGGGFGAPGGNSSTSHSSAIATWVSTHYTAKTVNGVTIYDLTAPR